MTTPRKPQRHLSCRQCGVVVVTTRTWQAFCSRRCAVRARRGAAVAGGLCWRCGDPVEAGRTNCAGCLAAKRQYARETRNPYLVKLKRSGVAA